MWLEKRYQIKITEMVATNSVEHRMKYYLVSRKQIEGKPYQGGERFKFLYCFFILTLLRECNKELT